jgi:MFS family permease
MSERHLSHSEIMAKTYYLLVTFVAGAAVLALEVLAARAMAPALGSGPVSWSALLATALGTLAIGSLFGGRLSERAGPGAAIAWALAVSAVYLVATSQLYGPALRWSAEQPLLIGEIIAAALVQAVPMMMLGLITPVILHHGRDGMGRWGGAVLAAGSGGGIAGALAAGLLLVPGLGLARSFLLLAALLAVAATISHTHPERLFGSGSKEVDMARSH